MSFAITITTPLVSATAVAIAAVKLIVTDAIVIIRQGKPEWAAIPWPLSSSVSFSVLQWSVAGGKMIILIIIGKDRRTEVREAWEALNITRIFNTLSVSRRRSNYRCTHKCIQAAWTVPLASQCCAGYEALTESTIKRCTDRGSLDLRALFVCPGELKREQRRKTKIKSELIERNILSLSVAFSLPSSVCTVPSVRLRMAAVAVVADSFLIRQTVNEEC